MVKILSGIRNLMPGLVVTALFFSAVSYASTIKTKVPGVLNVIYYSEFTPISYGVNGEGYEGDLLRAIAKLWNLEIKFHSESLYEGLWLLPSKSYTVADISMGGMTPSKARIKQGSLFSMGTTAFSQSLLVRKKDYQSGQIVSYQSFKKGNHKIGVVPGTTGELYAHLRAQENNLPRHVFVQYASESELLPALMKGQIDAIARGEIGNTYQESINKELTTIAQKSFGEHFAFAIDRSNKELVNNLNQAIQKITNNGKITYLEWDKKHTIFLDRVNQLKQA